MSIPWEMENRVDYLVKIEWSTPWKQNGVLHGNRMEYSMEIEWIDP